MNFLENKISKMDSHELLMCTCDNNENKKFEAPTINLWDYKTSNCLMQYKNSGSIGHHMVGQLNNDYLIGANPKQPILYLWQMNNPNPTKKFRLNLPSNPSCLSVCPNGIYLAVGIKKRLYIWQLASGKLLTIQKKNMRNITVVKFSANGMLVIVGAADGTLSTYKLVNLVSLHKKDLLLRAGGQTEPIYTKCDHNDAILDIHVGNLGLRSQFATSSFDKTIKIYKLLTGHLLHNIVTDYIVNSLVIDCKFDNAYLGCSNGTVLSIKLPESEKYYLTSDDIKTKNLLFQAKDGGHTKPVKCLSLNQNGSILASGSDDGTIILWDTKTKEDRSSIPMKMAITNLKFIVNHQNIWNKNAEVITAVMNLDMNFNLNNTDFGVLCLKNTPIESVKRKWESLRDEEENERLIKENMNLRAKNQQIYKFTMESLKNINDKN